MDRKRECTQTNYFMQISSVSTTTNAPDFKAFRQARETFESIGKGLDSGDLDEARAALEQFQKNAPAHPNDGNDPVARQMETLSKAIDSGDLAAAKTAYADASKTLANAPRRGAPPAGGTSKTVQTTSNDASTNTIGAKNYDKMDANQDGIVTTEEEFSYELDHPGIMPESGILDTTA